MLTSQAREALRGVETVIVDEVHAVAGTKRGAHLALSPRAARRAARQAGPAGRAVGHRPPGRGGGPLPRRRPPGRDRAAAVDQGVGPRGRRPGRRHGRARRAPPRRPVRVRPPGEQRRGLDLAARRGAHRRPHRRAPLDPRVRQLPPAGRAADRPAQRDLGGAARRAEARRAGRPTAALRLPPPGRRSWRSRGASAGAPAVLARAHHGSVSKEQRAADRGGPQGRPAAGGRRHQQPRARHRHGRRRPRRPGRVAAVASPAGCSGSAGPATRSGAVSRGRALPEVPRRPRADRRRRRADARRRRSRRCACPPTRSTCSPSRSWRCAPWTTGPSTTLEALVRRAAPFAALPRSVLEAVLDMLSGRYPSDEFAELRPRIVWDRVTGTLTGRPGAQRLAVTSGGTIPDRGLYGVFLAAGRGRRAAGRRARRGDGLRVAGRRRLHPRHVDAGGSRTSPTTGCSSRPAPGQPGRLPFWKGDALGRPAELGRAVGAFVREVVGAARRPRPAQRVTRGRPRRVGGRQPARLPRRAARGHPATCPTTAPSSSSGSATSSATGGWPCTRRSAAQVHAPWALCVAARMRERFGVDVQAMHGDDGIVLPAARPRVRGRRCASAAASEPSSSSWSPSSPTTSQRPGHRRDRRVGAVRRAVPRVRGPGPAAAAPPPRPAPAAVAAAPAVGPAARGGQPVRLVPDRARDGARVPPGRLRRARAGRADARHRVARGHRRRGRDAPAVAVRPSPAVRLRRAVPLRGRLAAGRAPRRRAGARPDPARRAARPRRGRWRCATCSTPRRVARTEAELQRLDARARLPRRRGRRRPAPGARPAAAPRRRWPAAVEGTRRRRRRRPGWSSSRAPAG